MENIFSLLPPLPPFSPSLLFIPPFFFSGKVVNLLLKGDLPVSSTSPFRKGSLCSTCSICHYEFWSTSCLSSGFPYCYGFNLIIDPAFPHLVQGRICLDWQLLQDNSLTLAPPLQEAHPWFNTEHSYSPAPLCILWYRHSLLPLFNCKLPMDKVVFLSASHYST